jgi:hypothetical protein
MMTKVTSSDTWVREELIHLLSVSATLAGLCVTVVALMNTFGKSSHVATVVDDIFAVCALLFLVSIYTIFSALRTRKLSVARALAKVVDAMFLAALTLMTVAAFMLVCTVW